MQQLICPETVKRHLNGNAHFIEAEAVYFFIRRWRLAGKSEPFHVLKCLVFQDGAHVGGAKSSKRANEETKELTQ
jgi:hypothetical protein